MPYPVRAFSLLVCTANTVEVWLFPGKSHAQGCCFVSAGSENALVVLTYGIIQVTNAGLEMGAFQASRPITYACLQSGSCREMCSKTIVGRARRPKCAGGQTPAASCPESGRRSRFRFATSSVLARWPRRCLDSENAARPRRRVRKTETLREATEYIPALGKKCQGILGGVVLVFPSAVRWAASAAAHRVVGVAGVVDRNNRIQNTSRIGMPGLRVHLPAYPEELRLEPHGAEM